MEYLNAISKLIKNISDNEKDQIHKCAVSLKNTVDQGGIVFVFGAGHSSIFAEEAFHRAGGLIPVHPILYDFLSPHISSKIAGKLERHEGIAPILFQRAGVSRKDMMWIASNSGINAAAIEMALECKKIGTPTIAITSMAHSTKIVSRHSSGKKLYECVEHVLDNHCPPGDALIEIEGVRIAAGSTIANSFLYHWTLTEACKMWQKEGKKLPIYISANLPGGDEHNEKMEASYRSRIPLL